MTKKTASKKTNVVSELCASLKVDADVLKKIALCEKALLQAKQDKQASKCKVIRQRARSLTFYRHEHDASVIAKLQAYSKTL